MRSLLGFHPPHFSEEEAWLPAWLQPSTISNQAVECPPGQAVEEIGHLQPSISPEENGNLPDDGTCKSLHLFLSGDDNSPMNFPSCSSNHEGQYHLHLSSNEESLYSLNPTLSRSQADKSAFNQALLARVIPKEGEACMVPSQQKGDLGNTGPKSSSFNNQKEVNPKVNARCQKADISDAIELSVAASEALTIHKVLKDECLIALSVLEAAIRVKQARLENFRENLSNSIEESSEVDFDFLSDLDDLTMADAYEDVGLTVASHGDLSCYGSISHVNDSFASENYIANAKLKGTEHGLLHIDSGSISPEQHKQVNNADILSKGSILESYECVARKEHVDYESLGTENANLACDVDPVFNCSVEQTDFFAKKVGLRREGFSIGDVTSSQTISRSNERQVKMTNLVPNKFQSRWFGGWTLKDEASIPAVTDDKYKRTDAELFANETSSLSESADIAPDMSSCVQRQDKTVSQSTIVSQHAYEKANNNGNLISDDVAVSPNVSVVDPLCSVVPCSFTSDSVESQTSKHQVNIKKHLDALVQPNLNNLEVNGESSLAICRQVASLKTFSMLYPRCDPYLDKEHTRAKSSVLEHNQTTKTDAVLISQGEKDGKSSSFAHNQTAKVDTALANQREHMAKVSRKVESIFPRRKRVWFSETEICYPQVKKFQKTPQTRLEDPLVERRICRRLTRSKSKTPDKDNKTLLQDLKFLLTGFSVKKHKQIKSLIQKNGGRVLDDIPSPSTSRRKRCSNLPLILCPKKLLTTKFLYGCAVNAGILKITWLFDSVDEGLILPHQKYKILNYGASDNRLIFDDIAIMLHGKQDFCSKMGKVIKHGGGSVFKTFHWLVKSLDSKKALVGVIVVEDENGISRQLKQCALEQKVPVMPYSWIINSLYAGRLLPSQLKLPDHLELSEEI